MSFTEAKVGGIIAAGCVVTISLFYLLRSKKKVSSNNEGSLLQAPKVPYEEVSQVGQPHPFSKESKFKGCVYLDYNATTPVFPEVTQAMMPFLTTCFGNPSSSHVFSTPCREGLFKARNQIGDLVNAKDSQNEIFLTSCGTESDNAAVDMAIHNFKQFKARVLGIAPTDPSMPVPHIITCITEHPAVICYLRVLRDELKVIRMTVLPVNGEGLVDVEKLKNALTPDTALVTIMHSNNEVGTIQPIRQIALCIKQYNATHQPSNNTSSNTSSNTSNAACVLLHSDAAQSLGKVLVDVQALGVDMLTIVGHKFGAPKGVGALYIRSNVEKVAMLVGGGQERGIRGGA
jgi:cysteine desulfurase